ncbi:VOC family protein [Virgibacillus kimchii]
MTGVEIDFIVPDSLKALEVYEKIFDIKRVEVTNFPKGENEVIFSLYGMHFHMLDENPQFGLKAPAADAHQTMWFNITVPDIKEIYAKAMEAGCKEMQAVTELADFGVSNASFNDPFGYHWMLHEVHREVSFEERVQLWEENREG